MTATGGRRWVAACAAAVVAASACFRTSASPESVVRQRIHGDGVSLYYGPGVGLDGELLAVTDTSFLVMRSRVWSQDVGSGGTTLRLDRPSGVITVPRRSIRRIEFGLVGFDTPGGVLRPGDLEKVVQRSRYPYGLSAGAMAELLRAFGQTTPDTVGLRSP
jgi:hypothetical protein